MCHCAALALKICWLVLIAHPITPLVPLSPALCRDWPFPSPLRFLRDVDSTAFPRHQSLPFRPPSCFTHFSRIAPGPIACLASHCLPCHSVPPTPALTSQIVDKYIGESARLVREMFAYAREHEPCIIFMDEIDAIGGRRFSEGTSADREIQRTLMEVSEHDSFWAVRFRSELARCLLL
jgi:hypothetical protein